MRRDLWQGAKLPKEGQGKPRVFVQVDGTGINDRAIRGWFEAKVRILFSETEEVSRDRVEILDKRLCATTEDLTTFRECLVLVAAQYGVFNSKRLSLPVMGPAGVRSFRGSVFLKPLP